MLFKAFEVYHRMKENARIIFAILKNVALPVWESGRTV